MSKDKFLFSFDFPKDIYGYPIKGDFYGNNNNQGKFIETGNGQFISTYRDGMPSSPPTSMATALIRNR